MTAAKSWGAAPTAAIARALAAAAGEPQDDAALQRCVDSALQKLPPAVAMQVLALVAVARPAWCARLRPTFDEIRLPPRDRDEIRIREVMPLRDARTIFAG